jgi:hypothetical protein
MTKKICAAVMSACFVLNFTRFATAADQDDIPRNATALSKEEFFSRPITELEMIVLNLKKQAKESAAFVAGDSRLHIIKNFPGLDPAEGDAGYNPTKDRVYLALGLHVYEMSDPWREVCDSTIGSFYGWFYFPNMTDAQNVKLAMIQKYFGEAVKIDKDNAVGAIDTLLNSIVTSVTFLESDNASSPLKWMRVCTKDNLTGRTSYFEHRYQ